jgi:hypothetical protein
MLASEMLLVIVYRRFISRKYFFCGFTRLLLNKYWKCQFHASISCSSCSVYSCIHLWAETYQISINPVLFNVCSSDELMAPLTMDNKDLNRITRNVQTLLLMTSTRSSIDRVFHGLSSNLVSVFSSVMNEHNPLPVFIFLVNHVKVSGKSIPNDICSVTIFDYSSNI